MQNNNDQLMGASAVNTNCKTLILAAMVSLLTAIVVIYMVTPFGAAVSPDSIFYLDIAAHIQQGHGFRSSDYSLAHVGQGWSVANTSWPPLYPILLAATGFPHPTPASAAVLSMLLLAATLFLLQLILARFLSWQISLLAVLPVAVTVPMLTVHVYVWSEQLFILLLMFLFWLVQNYLLTDSRCNRRRKVLIALIALTLTLSFYTRYIGIIYFPLLPLLYFFAGRPKNLLPTFIGSSLLSGFAAAALMAYNFRVSGSVTGIVRDRVSSSLADQWEALLAAFAPIFLDAVRAPLIVVISLLSAAALIYFVMLSRTPDTQPKPAASIMSRLSIAAVLYYLICISILRARVAFDEIDIRLVSVVIPYFWIACVASLINLGMGKKPLNLAAGLLSALAVVMMVVNGYLNLLDARVNWTKTGSPEFSRSLAGSYKNYNLPPFANDYRAFFSRIVDSGSVLIVDRPHVIQFTTGLTCVARPAKLSAVDLQRMSELPERSYMVVPNSELEAALIAFKQLGISPELTSTPNVALIHLPLKLNGTAEPSI